MRMPRLAELKAAPLFGTTLAGLLEAAGVTDDDLPDIWPASLEGMDEAEFARLFPTLHAKLAAVWPEVGIAGLGQ